MTITVHIKNDGPNKNVILKRYVTDSTGNKTVQEENIKVLTPGQNAVEVVWATSGIVVEEGK